MLIPSFSIDHTKIVPGIFVSRQDEINGNIITTYDIRLTRPNREPFIDVAAMHTLEHIIATYLRNDPNWKEDIIYWGPMGCLTGFYLIMKGAREPKEIYTLVLKAFDSVKDFEEVPGSNITNCGNYLMHNLWLAKQHAANFVEYLKEQKDSLLIFEYPKTDRLVTENRQQFFDS